MAEEPPSRPVPSGSAGTSEKLNLLKYSFDARFLSGPHPPDSPSATRSSTDSDSSSAESTRMADLAASVHGFSQSLLRLELAEMEMAREREARRLEAEKRRAQSEANLARLRVQTQLQVASLVARNESKRKRKRVEDDDSERMRKGRVVLGLLLCNLLV